MVTEPEHDGVLAHRLLQHEQQPVVARRAAGQDLETLNPQAADAVLGRDDAAIEGQLLALLEHLRLQVLQVLLDLADTTSLSTLLASSALAMLCRSISRSAARARRSAPRARAGAELPRTCCSRRRSAPFVHCTYRSRTAPPARRRSQPPPPPRGLITDYELTGAHRSDKTAMSQYTGPEVTCWNYSTARRPAIARRPQRRYALCTARSPHAVAKGLSHRVRVTWFAGCSTCRGCTSTTLPPPTALGIERFKDMERRLFAIMTIGAALTLMFGLCDGAVAPELLATGWLRPS